MTIGRFCARAQSAWLAMVRDSGFTILDDQLTSDRIANGTAIVSFAIALITFPFVPETYSPILLSQRANRLRHMTRNWAIRSKWDETESSLSDFAERYLLRPMRMLVLEPILLFMTLYISLSFGGSPTSWIEFAMLAAY